MLYIQDVLVSEDVVKEQFLCQLSACKGACCWEGTYGAPLSFDETLILDEIYEDVKPYLTPKGIAAIEAQGKFTYDREDDDFATTLVDNGPCAYLNYDELGIAKCGIEHAWKDGKTTFRKPISCHLYPIRVSENPEVGFQAINYERWSICGDACTAGVAAKLPVYQFLKEALVRKYGEDFYEELDAAAQYLLEKDKA